MPGIPKLIILSEQLRGKSFELTKDLYTVGRIEERDICIKDPTVSTYHCDFVKNNTTYILRDNHSTNGTRVNNVPITEQELQNSDILQIGGVEILYDCDDKSVTTVMRTQTNINLENTDLGATVSKMENFSPYNKGKKSSQTTHKIMMGLVLLLIILIVVLIGIVIVMGLKQGPPAAFILLNSLF